VSRAHSLLRGSAIWWIQFLDGAALSGLELLPALGQVGHKLGIESQLKRLDNGIELYLQMDQLV